MAQTTHVAGVDNIVYDGLSSGKSGLAVGLPKHPLVHYVALCDPSLPLVSTEDHTDLSVEFLNILGAM